MQSHSRRVPPTVDYQARLTAVLLTGRAQRAMNAAVEHKFRDHQRINRRSSLAQYVEPDARRIKSALNVAEIRTRGRQQSVSGDQVF